MTNFGEQMQKLVGRTIIAVQWTNDYSAIRFILDRGFVEIRLDGCDELTVELYPKDEDGWNGTN